MVVVGKKLAVGTGDLVHLLHLFHATAEVAPQAPDDKTHHEPSDCEAKGHDQRLNDVNQLVN